MGVMNLRAICPNCGGKIHTQPKGLGHLTWARSWFLVKTGSECQHCGVALSGKVDSGNKAILAEDADKSWWERETGSDRSRAKREAQNSAPTLSEKQKKADVIELEYASPSDALFAAVERAVDQLGYKREDSADRTVAFKTGMSMWSSGQRMDASVEDAGDGAILRLSRHGSRQLYDWGEKNDVTGLVLGAVQVALSHGDPQQAAADK